MSAKGKSKIAAWSLGSASGALAVVNLAVAVSRHDPGHGAPTGMWILLGVVILVIGWLTTLHLVLGHLAERPYRDLLSRAAADPVNAPAYREVIDADSRHQSVRNGAVLNDRQHGMLYRGRSEPHGPAA